MSATMTGRTGRLRSGARVVSEFSRWELTQREDGYFLAVLEHAPDPFWFERLHPERLRVELDVGAAVWLAPVRAECTEPLNLRPTEEFEVTRYA